MSHTVKVLPSGHAFQVEDDETILAAALRQGFAFPYGCRNGACGSCKGKLLSGAVDYGAGTPPGLSEEERSAGLALFCQARPRGDVSIEVREIGAAKDIVIKTLPCRVARMERLAPDVMRLFLKLPATERLQFLAGQYLDVLLRDGRRRGFSIANAPHNDACIELHVRHVEGGEFTGYVFNRMKEKDLLRIQAPLGSFFIREDSARPIIMMGGGTGFAPLKGMLEHAFHTGLKRPIHLFWGVRAVRDLYLPDVPQAWAASQPDFRYTPVLSEPLPEDAWRDATGLVHEAVVRTYPDLGAYEVYMSGPPAMIAAARQAFKTHGLPEEQLYYDSFEFAADHRGSVAEAP